MLTSIAPTWLWFFFGLLITFFLALDLGLSSHGGEKEVSTKHALIWTCIWIILATIFGIGVTHLFGRDKGLEYFTGFVIEKALSIDNIFVFIVIFNYFKVPRRFQHRVLFWGVICAFLLRALFIFLGAALISHFHWILYIFGAFLVYTGIKLVIVKDDDKVDPEKSLLVRGFRHFIPVTDSYEGAHFIVKRGLRIYATPLLLVLALIEGSDVVFAFDSIPAIFGVTTDPFIVYTSNIFAILGLRNLYFVLANFIDRFAYLKYGLGLVLTFVGAKMLAEWFYEVPVLASLIVIATLLSGTMLASIMATSRKKRAANTLEKIN
ncbi:MAG: TerC family protein [Deltaproteobacteria bacterium]|nr:TerC family protein [Deltaproteobacteria bacterium]